MIKKIIYIILTIIILGGSLYLAAYAGIEHRHEVYRSFSLKILNPQEKLLITEDELTDSMFKKFGKIEGKSLDEVPLFEIEQFIVSNPYVASANVYSSLNGDFSAEVETRVPMFRVINYFDESSLIDTTGMTMPVSLTHPVRLPVVSGHIDLHYRGQDFNINQIEKDTILTEVFQMIKLISRDDFLNALLGQVYVNEDHEIELIPKIGDQIILFGSSENAGDKIQKLKAFYTQVMKHTGWKVYKTINLKFDHQVVCSK